MSYRDELKKQLEGLPRTHCVAFAARCALRALPLLAAKQQKQQSFWFWEETKRTQYLLAILNAERLSFAYACLPKNIIFNKISAYAVAKNSNAASNAASKAAAYAAAKASNAAAYASNAAAYAAAKASNAVAYTAVNAYDAVYAAANATSDSAAYAAAYAAYSASSHLDFKHQIQSDLKCLFNHSEIETYLERPLWNHTLPKQFLNVWNRFQQWSNDLDAGFEVWIDWYQDRLDGKPIDLALLEKQANISAEIEDQGVQAVNRYLETLVSASQQKKELEPLNLVRAIFIGNGAAGKTSLIKVLNGEPVIEGKEKMTPGIDIRDWQVGDTDITAHFWDFGGQVMAHATHQFFLRERCLYVLVLDARTEINANEQAEYWLEHIKAFGKHAPVMLVGNKSDLTQVNLDLFSLREKYPNIIDFYPISCSQLSGVFKSRFDVFKQDLVEHLQQVGTHQVYFTEQQLAVMQTLQKRSTEAAFIAHQDFEAICAKQQITNTETEQNRDWLLDLFDKLGIVIHFPQLARLDSFILNPRWLTYGIYTLLYSELAQASQGQLSESGVIKILGKQSIIDEHGHRLDYSTEKCGFIVDAMEEFHLCYRLPADRSQIIIPDLLPSDQSDHGFNKQQPGTLTFEFDFRGFLPRHVMPTFIVSRYDEIKNNIVWQQGVLLHSDLYASNALLQVDYHHRSLSM